MKTFCITALLFTGIFLPAQQISVTEISRNSRFNKKIDELNNGKTKIKYSDIKGIPYYNAQFLSAEVGGTTDTALIRYNSFLDTVEIVDKDNVYELPKEEATPSFTFKTTKEKLVFVKTDDAYSGYFFELTNGKYRILKKVVTKYQEEIPAPNTMIAGTAARFDMQKPLYFIKTENNFFKMPKNPKELSAAFPDKAKALTTFLSENKIKLSREEDLIKLGRFLNQ